MSPRNENLFVPARSACDLYKNRAPKHYPAGRVCATCSTILSRYNPSLLCGLHEERKVEVYR